MTTINSLTAVDSISSADQFPIYQSANGDARKVSMNVITAYLNTQNTANDNKVTLYSAPSATAFNVAMASSSSSVWLILTPTGVFAAGTITLPPLANCIDRQELLVNSTQAITALTIAGNGATVTGAPTTMTANAFFRLRFDAVVKAWYRVG